MNAIPPIPVTVEIVNGVISCRPRGGHVHLNPKIDQSRIHWSSPSGERFELKFEIFDTEERVWPFSDPEPQWPVQEFGGTLRLRKHLKYNVIVAGKVLDPIIIVDP